MPPRQSKRKAANPVSSASSKVAHSNSTRSASSKAAPKVDGVDVFFNSYANQSMGMIDPEGIEALCSDLNIDVTDVRILMLAWKMKAEKQGYFSQDEWRRGLKALKVDTIIKLKKALPALEKEVLKPENFEDFYLYAFRYSLTEDKQKCVEIESICILLEIVLGPHYRTQVDLFIEYLKCQSDYKVINMDQWHNFFRFCNEISFPDFKDYDANQAWPLILDNFVEWVKDKETEHQL